MHATITTFFSFWNGYDSTKWLNSGGVAYLHDSNAASTSLLSMYFFLEVPMTRLEVFLFKRLLLNREISLPSVRSHGTLAKIHGKFLGSLAMILARIPWPCKIVQRLTMITHDLGKGPMVPLPKFLENAEPLFSNYN